MVSIDQQRSAMGATRRSDQLEAGHDFRGFIEHGRHHHTRRSIIDSGHQALRQSVARPRRHANDVEESLFGQPIDLSPETVELAIGGDQPRALPQRQAGEPARDQFVRILAEGDVGAGIAEQPSEAGADVGRAHFDAFPLVVNELRGVEPCLLLRVERHVRPRLVRVAGQ
jgi:hypothetical protein